MRGLKLGLDVMGGDYAPLSTIRGAVMALPELKANSKIVLIGDPSLIESALVEENASSEYFEILPASQTITMSEHPTRAVVQKPDSGIMVGMRALKEGSIDAFSSAGNTGAVLVGSMQILRPIPGVIRPCITSVLPKENGGVGVILDVGTNADCKPDVLYQFGFLGSLYAKLVLNIADPAVGLLNIGEEPEKGNLVSQSAHGLMTDSKDFRFIGNVEGRDLFGDLADVIVCEGFTGNVVLKEAEAFYTMIKKRKISDPYFDRFNYELYGGTPILGINAPVLIGHGISSPTAVKNMILLSENVSESRLHKKIMEALN
jgi:glycerol-3-phosphate acyltransferase PlsX